MNELNGDKKQWLSRAECSALRGLAILAIVLHNYCHWLRFAVKENEYQFKAANNEGLWRAICNPDENLFVHLVSYFGHYGVPVFLFLSGYGLVKKYEKEGEPRHGIYTFMRYHYLKLFKMMIVGFVAFIIVDLMTRGSWHYSVKDIVGQMAMLVNLFPKPGRHIWPGPYWFFGLMMQLYLVYRLFIYNRHSAVTVALMVVSCIGQMFFEPDGNVLNWLRYNSFGGMLPFGLGILLARQPYGDLKKLPWRNSKIAVCIFWAVLFAVFSAAVLAMSFNFYAWLLEPLVVIAMLVALVKALPRVVNERLVWLGGISAAMFVAHPTMRKIFIPVSHRGDVYDGLLLYVIATIAVSWMFKLVIDKIPNPHLK